MASAAFDKLASRYDELWTHTSVGLLQREAVWRELVPLYRRGETILDLGCGTGEDALHFTSGGIKVVGFDSSTEMVLAARRRGVDARLLEIEQIQSLEGSYDGAISNFGALNCVQDLAKLRQPLARLIRSGGYLALCVIGRFCLWETLHFLSKGKLRKVARRWTGVNTSASLGLRVFYTSVRQIRQALAPDFLHIRTAGIGLCVPPSYVSRLSSKLLARFDAVDRRIAHRSFFRALTDHRFVVFKRK
jgi:ubiquinone/menaquinone biosynthesis C-methylase UbiE